MKYASLRIIHDMLVRADQLALEEYEEIDARADRLDKAIYEARSHEERQKIGLEFEETMEQRKASQSKRNAIKAALDDFESYDWR